MPDRTSVALYIGGFALFALIIGALIFFQREPVDQLTGCPESGPKSTTVVVIDTSDSLSPTQKTSFRKFLDTLTTAPQTDVPVTANSDAANYVAKGHLLVAYEIMSDENAEAKLLFKFCNPGNPEERSLLEALTRGKVLADLQWHEFKQKLQNAFPAIDKKGSAPVSPIIETLKYVRSAEFPSPADLKSSRRNAGTMFIVSDMLQNSTGLTHYNGLTPARDVPSRFALDLTGISFGILYLKVSRYAHLQYGARPHFRWWREFFAAAGAPLNKPPDFW